MTSPQLSSTYAKQDRSWSASITDNWRALIDERLRFLGKQPLPDRPLSFGQMITHVWVETGYEMPKHGNQAVERWLVTFCDSGKKADRESSPYRPNTEGWLHNALVIDGIDVRSREFLMSFAWRRARYQFLLENHGDCRACGRNPRDNGVVINVDHIYPRSAFPHFALEMRNFQILCDECNHGKANSSAVAWERRL